MKKVLLVVTLLIVILMGVVAWIFLKPKKDTDETPKEKPMTVSMHSESFNVSMNKALDAYYALTESFVNWDTVKVSSSLVSFKTAVDSINIPEMQKDSAIYETAKTQWESIQAEVAGMQADTSLHERREDLNSLSQQMFDLLRIVKYDISKVYYHECPMALNNYEASAFWLSTNGETKNRRNPYLGLHDPKYGKAMLTCGMTRDSINFSAGQTGK